MTLYHPEDWGIAIQYFEQGKHLENLDYIDPWTERHGTNIYDEINLQRYFEFRLNREYIDPIVYSKDQREALEGLINSGERIKRSVDNNHLFSLVEKNLEPCLYKSPVGFIREIWRLDIEVKWRGYKSYSEQADGSIKVTKEETCAA